MGDLHDLMGAYVLDALGELERTRFRTHLRECPRCRAELSTLEDASSALDDPHA
ncbi:zf-HC2 domain-containing protein [Aeromicrobium sp. Root495]|uniref:zf-HC2 domain-containing protein n=1 Tax=Aeromicrobium sp. Root495 TaxID=1736550 RepID=UPI0009E7CC56|nr:zf-HC2 domain-containing protein [Aeromicrobium sp. Root495]